jgi:hypothetical protein
MTPAISGIRRHATLDRIAQRQGDRRGRDQDPSRGLMLRVIRKLTRKASNGP